MIAGLAGAATFLTTFAYGGWLWWVSLLLTAMIYLGANLVLGGMLDDRVRTLLASSARALARLEQQALQTRAEVVRLRQLAGGIDNPELRTRLDSVCALADKILDNFEQDPDDLQRAHHFLSHFQKVLPMVGHYAHLSRDPDRRQVIGDEDEALVIETVATLENSLREAYRAFQDNNLQEMRVATGTLKRMMALDNTVSRSHRELE